VAWPVCTSARPLLHRRTLLAFFVLLTLTWRRGVTRTPARAAAPRWAAAFGLALATKLTAAPLILRSVGVFPAISSQSSAHSPRRVGRGQKPHHIMPLAKRGGSAQHLVLCSRRCRCCLCHRRALRLDRLADFLAQTVREIADRLGRLTCPTPAVRRHLALPLPNPSDDCLGLVCRWAWSPGVPWRRRCPLAAPWRLARPLLLAGLDPTWQYPVSCTPKPALHAAADPVPVPPGRLPLP